MTTHPLTNNSKITIIRQAAIGLTLGIVAVFFLSMILGEKQPDYNDVIEFDTESVPIIPIEASLPTAADAINDEKIGTDTPTNLKPANASEFPFFNKNRAQLSNKQLKVIADNNPHISVILGDMGQQSKMISAVIESIPNDVTIALSPYARGYNDLIKKLDNYGFETWMDIAALTLKANSDSGNVALNPVNNFETNIGFLDLQLENKDKITGVILPQQALITETAKLWEKLTYEIFANGYGLLDNTSTIMRPSLYFYNDNRAPYIKGDNTLSSNQTIEEFKKSLNDARKSTLDQGAMIITISEPTPTTLNILGDWIKSLESDGITLVPLSAQAKL